MSKRIVLCADGTWNRPDELFPSNVVKMARAIAPADSQGRPQVVFYDQGVGTGPGILDRWLGGLAGKGLEKNIQDLYRFLIHNYEDGDEIFFFGFSRGAYTVRSTAGLIRNCGLLKKVYADILPKAYELYKDRGAPPWSEEAEDFRSKFSQDGLEIKFMGVWDTVGSLGIPLQFFRRFTMASYQFHDVELSRIVRHAYHALAVDERRGSFEPTLWKIPQYGKEGQAIEQVWFSGVHSDVGGGYRDTGLADVSFLWMKEKAEGCGLAFDEQYIYEAIHPDGGGCLHNSRIGIHLLTPAITRPIGELATEAVHPCAQRRYEQDHPPYNPENLKEYLQRPDPRIASTRDPHC